MPAVTRPTPRPAVRTSGRRRVVPGLAFALSVLAGSVLAGCAGPQTSPPTAGQVSTWMTSANAGTAIGQVEVDSRNVTQVLAKHEPASAVKAACALLTTDALTAIGNLPSPDTALTDALNAAYQDASAAGDDCFQGATAGPSLLRRSAEERTRLASLLTTAVDRYRMLTGHTPTTSTTLAPSVSPDPFAS